MKILVVEDAQKTAEYISRGLGEHIISCGLVAATTRVRSSPTDRLQAAFAFSTRFLPPAFAR